MGIRRPRLPADVDELLGRQSLKSPQVECPGRQLQQLAVPDARPAHRGDGADVVLGQQPGERPRQRLIQQNAHRQPAGLARVREPRLLDRVSPWGSCRETGQGVPGNQVIEDVLHGDPGPAKHGCAPEDLGVAMHDGIQRPKGFIVRRTRLGTINAASAGRRAGGQCGRPAAAPVHPGGEPGTARSRRQRRESASRSPAGRQAILRRGGLAGKARAHRSLARG